MTNSDKPGAAEAEKNQLAPQSAQFNPESVDQLLQLPQVLPPTEASQPAPETANHSGLEPYSGSDPELQAPIEHVADSGDVVKQDNLQVSAFGNSYSQAQAHELNPSTSASALAESPPVISIGDEDVLMEPSSANVPESTSTAIPSDAAQEVIDAKEGQELTETALEVPKSQDAVEAVEEEEDDEDEANTTVRSSLQFSLTTPLKSLPALKDIEPIITPKSFNVARDGHNGLAQDSPTVFHNILDRVNEENDDHIDNNIEISSSEGVSSSIDLTTLASHLHISPSYLQALNPLAIESIQRKIAEAQEFRAQLNIASLNLEKTIQIQGKKLQKLNETVKSLQEELEQVKANSNAFELETLSLKEQNHQFYNHQSDLQKQVTKLETELEKNQNDSNNVIESKNDEILRLSAQVDKLMGSSIEENTKLNELVSELNSVRNEKFQLQLDLSKANNELSYSKGQKTWYEAELAEVQKGYTDLIKKHESEYINSKAKLAKAEAQTKLIESVLESLKKDIASAHDQLLKTSSELADYKLESQNKIHTLQADLKSKDEVLELTQLQSEERQQRINQLDSYIEGLKGNMENSVEALRQKEHEIAELKENLKNAESVLDEELRKESALPKLSKEAEELAAKSPTGMLLLVLYLEFSSLKKQLVLEKLQKQKLAHQLEIFTNELEQKKPAIAGYRDQLKLYQSQLKEAFVVAEEIRSEKVEIERQNRKLESSKNAIDVELVAMKQLCKDLGSQLCYYLIHLQVRESPDGKPLSVTERKAIENILKKTNNGIYNDKETESDLLISTRLVNFKNIIELQQRNEELLSVVRQLSKQLEAKEASLLESVAVNEAKDAIMTLQKEIERIGSQLEAVQKERDALREINGNPTNSSHGGNKYLDELNKDLRKQLSDSENLQKDLKSLYEKQIEAFNEKIGKYAEDKSRVELKNLQLEHTIALAESRYSNLEQVLESTKKELVMLQNDRKFWKEQTSKQEKSLVETTTSLRKIELEYLSIKTELSALKSDKVVWNQIENHLHHEIDQLRKDKLQLNEFVSNLQSLFKQRENLSKDLEACLDKLLENYNDLQLRLNEKEERIMILTSQAELSMKSQNTNLDQMQELLELLLKTKDASEEKNGVINRLNETIKGLESELNSQRETQKKLVEKAMNEVGSGDSVHELNFRIELDSLRNELLIARKQLDEFAQIAKSSDEALINSTKAFEEYRTEIETERNAILEERESLKVERDEIKLQLSKLESEILESKKAFEKEISDSKLQLQEVTLKADAYDQLQADYEKKLTTIKSDFDIQVKLNQDVQIKYNDQFSQNEKLSVEVSELKLSLDEAISKYQTNEKELNSKKVESVALQLELENAKSSVTVELEKSKERVANLEDQNEILLNQIQLNGRLGDKEGSSEEDQSLEIVSYLRREKAAADLKLASVLEEQQKLEQKLKHTIVELEIAKSDLRNSESNTSNVEESKKEHQKLMEQVEQLNILRESNTTLRSELAKTVKSVQKLSVELKIAQKQVPELQQAVSDLTTQKELQEQTIKLAKEEVERYKNFSRSESNGADAEVSELKASIANKELELSQMSVSLQSITKELESVKTQLESALKEVATKAEENEKVNKEYTSLNERFTKLKTEAQEKLNRRRDELKQANANIEKLNSQLQESSVSASSDGKIQAQLEALQKEKSDLELQVKTSSENLNKVKLEHEVTQKELSKQIEELKKQQQSSVGGNGADLEVLKKDHENQINILKEEFSKDMEKARDETKKLSEKTTELRVKMLNKKISKLTQQLKDSQSKEPAVAASIPAASAQAIGQKRPAEGVAQAEASKKPKE